ncbi:MAG TPA: pyridoxamine 5'-phosphate oxidase family protein [Acidimicrobiales bacterium]|nr:pyridoxamine 5'-phosphate oxidase family protein [Acidimicrobiales bacterium]HUX03705.1 pyridoxamine 5'-phosphate oxidase family protein [Acidimicrobiales bacterium]
MSANDLGPGPRTRVRRLPKKASYDAETIYAILDEARLCHVAAIVDGRAVALPTLHSREGNTLFIHGSQSNAVLRSIIASGEACLTVTLYDGLRLARSGFESSIAYRSVVVFGAAVEVVDGREKMRVLDGFVDAVLPGRANEVRPMSDQEQRLTLVVAVSVDEASAKVSEGPTEDPDDDKDLPIWSGSVPARVVFDQPVPSIDGAMASGVVAVPASVRALLEGR